MVMDNGIIAALIGVGGVLITAVVTIVVAKRQSYSNTVTKERSVWLQHFREEVNSLFAGLYVLRNHFATNKKQFSDIEINFISKAVGARASLVTRLKSFPLLGNEFNQTLKEKLMEIDFNSENKDIEKDILPLINIILEREWEKVKNEK